MDVVRSVGLCGAFFSGASGDVSGFGGGRCVGRDAGAGEQSSFDGGGECLAFAGAGAGKILVGGGVVFFRGGIAGKWGGNKKQKRGMGSGGLGLAGGGEFFADGRFGGKNSSADWVAFIWAVDDGGSGHAVRFGFTGLGMGRVGHGGGAGVVRVGGGFDWGAGLGGVGGDRAFGGPDRSERGLCFAGVVVGGFGGVGGGDGGKSGGGFAGEGAGAEGGGGGISFRGGVGGLGLGSGRR